MTDGSSPVSAIEGIGPATEERLQQADMHTVEDLLRTTRAAIHDAVSDVASAEEAGRWRDMASLLDVEPMDPQWAEALVSAEVDSVAKLAGRSFVEVSTLFAEARDAGVIPSVPAPEQVAAMQQDAAVLAYTGLLVGTVVDTSDAPLEGARVRIGTRSVETDVRGRFRLLRIPLGAGHTLVIEKDGFGVLVDHEPPVLADRHLVSVTSFALEALAPGSEPARLDEFAGDELPPHAQHDMVIQRQPVEELRQGDILVLHKFLSRDPDAILASVFYAYESGQTIVSTYRVPRSRLPEDAALRDHFRVTGTDLVPEDMSPSLMQMYLAARRMDRAFAEAPRPQTTEERRQDLLARLAYLSNLPTP